MAPRRPKYQEIFETLKEGIAKGLYAPGQKLPSESALMTQFDASRITVVRALRDLQVAGLLQRRAGSGSFVTGAIKRASSLLFGLLIPNLSEIEIFGPICQSIADSLQSLQHGLLWGNINESDEMTQSLKICEQYINQSVAGIFFAPLEFSPKNDEVNRAVVAMLEQARIPIILLDRCYLPYPSRSQYDLVSIDHRRAGFMITKHLIDSGCERIALVAHRNSASTIEARIAGYQEALLSVNLEVHPEFIHRITSNAREELKELMADQAPDGLVCANDRTAGEVMRLLGELGYRIPNDVSIIGIDDVQYANLLPVPLTTAHQPCKALGLTAVTAMLDRIATPSIPARDISLGCEIVVRESVRKQGDERLHEGG
jgi:GntR family transcriptional regulator, arabinose operon transcriptional repressor